MGKLHSELVSAIAIIAASFSPDSELFIPCEFLEPEKHANLHLTSEFNMRGTACPAYPVHQRGKL